MKKNCKSSSDKLKFERIINQIKENTKKKSINVLFQKFKLATNYIQHNTPFHLYNSLSKNDILTGFEILLFDCFPIFHLHPIFFTFFPKKKCNKLFTIQTIKKKYWPIFQVCGKLLFYFKTIFFTNKNVFEKITQINTEII